MIILKKICKTYYLGEEEVKAVCGVDLEIKEKEFISVLGASGCGKSTLMYLIGLLEIPTSGKIYIENKDVSRLSDDELSKLRNEYVGFVFAVGHAATSRRDVPLQDLHIEFAIEQQGRAAKRPLKRKLSVILFEIARPKAFAIWIKA